MKKSSLFDDAGFTLTELMVVVVIVGILATISLPPLQIMFLKGYLESAKPYLAAIAAKERTYKIQNGSYLAATDEQDIENNLGVNLQEAGSFCFIVRTDPADFISSVTGSTVYTQGNSFEVWAVLRDTNYNTSKDNDRVTVKNGNGECTTADQKNAAEGWVRSTTDNDAFEEGWVVVLRYPPMNGQDPQERKTSTSGQLYWMDGISISDPML